MAKSTSHPPKKPTPINSNVAVEEPPPDIQSEIPPDLQPSVAQASSQAPPPPPKRADGLQFAGMAKTLTFEQTMNKIPKADWGPRANIYLYRVEPVIDRTRSGDLKFICTYAEPLNEDRVLADYGSGRYKLMLNYRKAGANSGDLLDSVYMDILNMKYPPKIPLGEWVDDPKNKKWAWAKEAIGIPATPQPAATGLETVVEVMRATNEMRRDIRSEMQTDTPSGEKPAVTPAAVDPWSAAEKILNMRSENPMVAILQEQMKVSAAATEAERARAFTAAEAAREREFKLQQQLLESKTTAAPAKTLLDQVSELVGQDTIKKFIGDMLTGKGPGETMVRAGRTTALDVARDLGSKFFESDLAMGVGQYLASLATRNVSGNPAQMNPGAPQNGVQRPIDDFAAFIENVLNPALLRHYIQGFTGGEFAGWLYDGYPDRVVQLQNFTHPMMPGLRGQNAIVQAYKNTPNMWPTLSSARPEGESAFVHFVHEFCQWKPEPNEPIDVQPIEHDGEQEEEGPERI